MGVLLMLYAMFRAGLSSALLFSFVVVVAMAIHARQALPAERPQSIGFQAPIPQPKPSRCKYSFALLQKEVPGWRVIPRTSLAIRYMIASGVTEGPFLDSAAYKSFGDKVAVVGLFRGCVVMSMLAEKKAHDAAITKTLGLVV